MSFPHWDKLTYGIESGECILFLGPELSLRMPDGSNQVPTHSLGTTLLEQLDETRCFTIYWPCPE